MKNISYDLIEKFRDAAGKTETEAEAQILAGETDGAYFYALSKDRSNLFSWYPWSRGMQVLQLGADYGVYCPAVADNVKALDIVDARDENLALIRFRYPKRIKEAGGNVGLLRHVPRSQYDVVLLPFIPAEALAKKKGDLWQLLFSYLELLKEGGSLLFAIDNAGALKYAAGAKKDPDLAYASLAQLDSAAAKLPFGAVHRYYPLPDWRFAKDIYSDAHLPDAGAFRGIAASYLEPRYALCDEEAVYGMLAKNQAFPPFAPAYLFVLENYHRTGSKDGMVLPTYIRFNRSRLPEYGIKTEILPEQNGKKVRKTALSEEANAHIASFEAKYKLLTHDLLLRQEEAKREWEKENPAERQKDKQEAAFRENADEAKTKAAAESAAKKAAESLTEDEAKKQVNVQDGSQAAPEANSLPEKTAMRNRLQTAQNVQEAECALPKLLAPQMGQTAHGLSYAQFDFLEGKTMAALLGAEITEGRAPIGKIKDALEFLMGTGIHACHNLDLVFENVMQSGDAFYLLDYEWVFEYPLNRNFVRYRILRYWYEAYQEALYAYSDLYAFLEEFGLRGDVLADCEAREKSFQEYVHGTGEAGGARFLQPEKTLADIRTDEEKLKEFTAWNLRLQDEVEEHKTALKKEREVERLSQNHIHNIETINKNQKETIDGMQAELAYLRRHQSLPSRAVRRLVAEIDKAAPAGSRKRKLIHYAKNTLRHPAASAKLYFTEEGRNRIAGDFAIGGEYAEGGMLQLPDCKEPLVSIVLPVYNQIGYTYACVRSILAHTEFDQTPYEIILADDVSTDATAEIGKYIKGLVISRNTENQGFLKNCNQAAKRALGKYILFLNNDTKVTEGWLSSLVRLIESDASIGMVGSKLVYPDGRLQEAGGIIWSDGSGWNYGRLDDPAKPEYNYVKDVDYISGAAIMLSKALWNEIGGFDERFAPAYCEDSDLAFEVRRRNKRVVLQPQSVVIHYEGISNGTDVSGTGLKRYQVVNQEKFREKWKDALKQQSVNDGNPNPFAARERSQKKPCVLIIDHYVPTWDKDAGSRTTYQYIRMFLKMGWNVKFLGDNFLHEEPYSSKLEQLGVEILYGAEHQKDIYDWIQKNQDFIDVAYLNRPHIAVKYIDFIRENTKIKRVYYGHDLHFMRLGREYEMNGDIRTKREADYWKSVEFSVMEQADMIYYPSESEIEAIHAVNPKLPAKAITAYVWDQFEVPNAATGLLGEDYAKREGLLFVGGFAHPPNADGVLWFAKKIFPLIQKELPDVKFYIAGSHETEEIKALANEMPGISVLGFVSDEKLHELYHNTKLVVVPLRYGAGVKGKVVEALYNGAVIVTTSVGAEGIPEAESVMAVTDACAEDIYSNADAVEQRFAEAVVRLYQDDAFCRAANQQDQRYIRQYYSMDAAWHVVAPDFVPRIAAHQGKTK